MWKSAKVSLTVRLHNWGKERRHVQFHRRIDFLLTTVECTRGLNPHSRRISSKSLFALHGISSVFLIQFSPSIFPTYLLLSQWSSWITSLRCTRHYSYVCIGGDGLLLENSLCVWVIWTDYIRRLLWALECPMHFNHCVKLHVFILIESLDV